MNNSDHFSGEAHSTLVAHSSPSYWPMPIDSIVENARVFERDKGWPDRKGFGMFLLNFIKKIISRRKRCDLEVLKPSSVSRKGRSFKGAFKGAFKGWLFRRTDCLAVSNWFATDSSLVRNRPHSL